jgi:hypothetical protein
MPFEKETILMRNDYYFFHHTVLPRYRSQWILLKYAYACSVALIIFTTLIQMRYITFQIIAAILFFIVFFGISFFVIIPIALINSERMRMKHERP